MVTVRLVGGLGNQLFQYAYARTLPSAQLFDACNQYGCLLSKLNIKLPIVNSSEGRWISERSLRYDPSPEVDSICTLAGYWQCERYFQGISEEIKSEYTLRCSPSMGAQESFKRIEEEKNSTMLHIRRGDYLTWARERHGVLPVSYYQEAIKFVPNSHIFVFSDDPAWARNLSLPYPMTIVNHSPCEDLWLMSACKNAVIANSSFSWWGAWLGPDKKGTVVAPRQWFAKGNEDAQDIVPLRWNRI